MGNGSNEERNIFLVYVGKAKTVAGIRYLYLRLESLEENNSGENEITDIVSNDRVAMFKFPLFKRQHPGYIFNATISGNTFGFKSKETHVALWKSKADVAEWKLLALAIEKMRWLKRNLKIMVTLSNT